MSRMRSLEQERADFAWRQVNSVTSEKDEYKNLAKGAPALVMSNGLMQTLAFYHSRGKRPAEELARHLEEWLAEKKIGGIERGNCNDVMPKLQSCDTRAYLHATDEVLEILRWIRQFADALFKEKSDAIPRS